MNSFDCRGRETRIRLVIEYEIIPVSHLPLLKGQKKYSAAKDIITKEYYCFSYKKKNTNDKPEIFVVGMHAAKHFLELLKHEPIPIFNILNYDINSAKEQKNKSISLVKEKWDLLARELYIVINIILMVWDANGGALSNILLEIRNNKEKKPDFKLIKSVNTIINSDRKIEL